VAESRFDLPIDSFVGLAEQLTPLGMAQNDEVAQPLNIKGPISPVKAPESS